MKWADKMRTKTSLRYGAILTIGLMIVVCQRQIVGGMTVVKMVISGQPRFCPLVPSINSYADTRDQYERAREIRNSARLVDRDPAGFERYEMSSQQVWIPTGSLDWIAFDLAEQEYGIYDYHGLGARPGDLVIDAGANVGLYTRHALSLGASKVLAIEPAPLNVECLRRNLRDEIAAGRVIVCEKGVWDKDDYLEMHLDQNATGHSFVVESGHKVASLRLPLTTVDNLVNELYLEKVDFIKMDIEGAERRALAGTATVIRRFRPRIAVCVYHLEDDPVEIPTVIRLLRQDYIQACGPCLNQGNKILPRVYFYY
jgi:FkbM family methyltransferase